MEKYSEKALKSSEIKERKLKEKRKKPGTSKSSLKAEFDSLLAKGMVIYNYEDQTKDFSKKREKMIALHKLLEWIIESDRKFIDHVFRPNLDKVWDMITQNIVRPLPNKKAVDFDATEGDAMDCSVNDKSWPTLELVYEILLHVIKHPSVSESHLKHFLTESFIQELLDLFETENGNERDYLKQVTHKLYAKVVKRRKLFRKMFNNHFLSLIYERPAARGANEILDIYSAIISGFAVPLRPEHIEFFKLFLTPLLKMQTCSIFYEELLRCILIFLNKDKNLAEVLVKTVLDFWPYANTTKELAFLITLYESMDFIMELPCIDKYIEPLFKRIASCLNSEHVQVIDRCMTFFERDTLINMTKENSKVLFPIIVPPIERQIKEHWHPSLKGNFKDLRSILNELDPDCFQEVKEKYESVTKAKLSKRADLDSKWKALEDKIKQNKPDYESPELPFKSDALVSDFNSLYLSVGQKDSTSF